MIVGSGLLAQAYNSACYYKKKANICIYASGVSNSSCVDDHEFNREKSLLLSSISQLTDKQLFVYFSTCAIYDNEMQNNAYVRHKLAMEKLVSEHENYLIIRLPLVVGKSPNPNTLFNHIYSSIIEGRTILVWEYARRYIIDVDDIVKLSRYFIDNTDMHNLIVNISSPCSYSITEIIETFERVLNRNATHQNVKKGKAYTIDVRKMLEVATSSNLTFGKDYLGKVVRKYYEK